VTSVGTPYDNALAETIVGLFKPKGIRHREPWRHLDAADYAAPEWIDGLSHRRMPEPIGNVPPADSRRSTICQRVSCRLQLDSNPEVFGKSGALIPPR